ncbi:hypothetical protein OSO01_44920 [Oceanobacillus sojae]|uniref:Uncharacterized protein n=1 Tax=Oceanobacillus sojae TaxID=582851 RepID=A0A511ZQM4_9BACI|nr:hypothetical protein OSO01_44920 [Oceanobacillus sojae]
MSIYIPVKTRKLINFSEFKWNNLLLLENKALTVEAEYLCFLIAGQVLSKNSYENCGFILI